MKKRFELLAPGGDIDSIKAAIAAGADAIYCGLPNFNARNRAVNISLDDLNGIVWIAHQNNVKIFITLNISIIESELSSLFKLLNKLVNIPIDGVIVQDIGVFYIIDKYFKKLEVHASTQTTTHNEGQIQFLKCLGAKRANLSRELNINEIKKLTKKCHSNDILTEVFVHGSYCIAFSGLCYFSSFISGNSGNRGRCSQPCRDEYIKTDAGKSYPFNLKDNSAFHDIENLRDAGVDSLKIEGRIKQFHYVYTIVNAWRKNLNNFYKHKKGLTDDSELYKVFNRDFSNSFLNGNISNDMFIDNPRDNSLTHFTEAYDNVKEIETIKKRIYDEKTKIINNVKSQIKFLSIEKQPVDIKLSGELNAKLNVEVSAMGKKFNVQSDTGLEKADRYILTKTEVKKRFKNLSPSNFYVNNLDMEDLGCNLFISFKEQTTIKNKIIFFLNNSVQKTAEVSLPVISKAAKPLTRPSLSIIIDSVEDLHLQNTYIKNTYYKLPDYFEKNIEKTIDIFNDNKNLTPWFPSILIGKDYKAAVEFLSKIQPEKIVTDNTGIAFEAFSKNISWTAGPSFNCMNSYSLLCLKEKFNCSGAFPSTELNKNQLKRISAPDNFELFYSVFSPVLLFTTRQCLQRQVNGCTKKNIDEKCMQECSSNSKITNMKGTNFYLNKREGNYQRVYNYTHCLNIEIIGELYDFFSNFLIDLRNIPTKTEILCSKEKMIALFADVIGEKPNAIARIKEQIKNTDNKQYLNGI